MADQPRDREQAETTGDFDIGDRAQNLRTYSEAALERMDRKHRISFKWIQKRLVLGISSAIILAATLLTIGTLVFSGDADARRWAQELILILVGYSAGALWPSSRGNDD